MSDSIGKIIPKLKLVGKINTSKIYPELEDLEVTPSMEEQNFKSSKYGYNNVKVKKGVDSSDATATSIDILKDKTAYINNEKITGTIESYDGSYSGNVAEEIKITDASYLFYYGARLENVNKLLRLCQKVTSCKGMFSNCWALTDLDLSNFDTSNVTNMNEMFYQCTNLTNLSNLNTSNVTQMAQMFRNCTGFTSLDLSNFNTSNVNSMYMMFQGCTNLTTLDLSSFDMSAITNIDNMLYNCTALINLKSFKNLGKGYTQTTNNNSAYRLNLSRSTKLTHESLMDIINNLYDLNLSYDVANGGTLYRQSCNIGSTNLAKLQATEEGQLALSEADRKGWDVS